MTESTNASTAPVVGILMGSDSDLDVMRPAAEALADLDVPHEVRVISAHRTPLDALEYSRSAVERGLKVIIAGAGGAAHLAGVLASSTPLPVIGVPVPSTPLAGMDSLLSIVQMPSGIPVATVAVSGARNAALLAARILGVSDDRLRGALERLQDELARSCRDRDARVKAQFEGR